MIQTDHPVQPVVKGDARELELLGKLTTVHEVGQIHHEFGSIICVLPVNGFQFAVIGYRFELQAVVDIPGYCQAGAGDIRVGRKIVSSIIDI